MGLVPPQGTSQLHVLFLRDAAGQDISWEGQVDHAAAWRGFRDTEAGSAGHQCPPRLVGG